MALSDFRKLVEAGPWGHVAVEVVDPNAARPVRLDVSSLHVELDESEAGELFDALAAALRTVVGGRAVAKLHDTPRTAGSGAVSEGSGKV